MGCQVPGLGGDGVLGMLVGNIGVGLDRIAASIGDRQQQIGTIHFERDARFGVGIGSKGCLNGGKRLVGLLLSNQAARQLMGCFGGRFTTCSLGLPEPFDRRQVVTLEVVALSGC